MVSIEFNGQLFNEESLTELKPAKLLAIHNDLSALVPEAKATKRFSNKTTGVRRTWALLNKYADQRPEPEQSSSGPAPATNTTPTTPEAPRAPREMRFIFTPLAVQRTCRVGSLRQECVSLLQRDEGATFDDIKALVITFDQERNKAPWNVEKRAYELIRIVHYHLGYGLRQDGDQIMAYTESPY